MCSSKIAQVLAGGADYLEETSSVCGRGGVRARERERERERDRERRRERKRGGEGLFVSINGV